MHFSEKYQRYLYQITAFPIFQTDAFSLVDVYVVCIRNYLNVGIKINIVN